MAKKEITSLEFGCRFRGYKIKTQSTVRDKFTKQATLGDSIDFVDGKCVLDTERDIEKIRILVNRDDFENDKPGSVKIWPSNADVYNEFAKENDLPLVGRKGTYVPPLTGEKAENIKIIADQQIKIALLQAKLEAVQNSVTTSDKKRK